MYLLMFSKIVTLVFSILLVATVMATGNVPLSNASKDNVELHSVVKSSEPIVDKVVEIEHVPTKVPIEQS